MDSSQGQYLSDDYYPVSKFNDLSKKVRNNSIRPKTSTGVVRRSTGTVSPREEIYKSILKELRSPNVTKVNTLVKKASKILRLSHADEDASVTPKNTKEKTETIYNSLSSKEHEYSTAPSEDLDKHDELLRKDITEDDKFLYHVKVAHQEDVLRRLAQNGGDFSNIWEDLVQDPFFYSNISSSNQSTTSKASLESRATTASSRSIQRNISRPPWKYFGNQKGLSTKTSNSNASVTSSSNRSMNSSATFQATMTSKRSLSSSGEKIPWGKNRSSRPATATSVEKASLPSSKDKRNDYLRYVFAVKGRVVTFKGNGFESFSNWFGDDLLLQKLKKTVEKARFRAELDVVGFLNEEIFMKIYDGRKLVVEAYRPMKKGVPPLRFKTVLMLPRGVGVEELAICRTSGGRLIIQDAPQPWSLIGPDVYVDPKRI